MKTKILCFTILLTASNLFGAYEIKIAKYKNHTYLMLEIAKIKASEYRKNIVIEKRNDFYYVTSTLYEEKNKVKEALAVYKKMFPDAFVVETEQKIPVPAATEVVAQTPEVIEKEHVNALNAKRLLENKTVYLCNENKSKNAKEQIVKMDFKKEYVLYSKLGKGMPPIKIPYRFDHDCVILPMSGIDFKYKIYQERQDFLATRSFINEKEGNHFRYYFDKEAALSYVAGNQ